LSVVEALHQVFKRSPAPVAVDRVDKFLSVSGRAVEVDKYDDVSISCEQLEVPAIAPLIAHWNLGPAVNDELHGIFLVGIKIGWLDQEALDFVAVSASEPEGFER